jgi:hypothetical protein
LNPPSASPIQLAQRRHRFERAQSGALCRSALFPSCICSNLWRKTLGQTAGQTRHTAHGHIPPKRKGVQARLLETCSARGQWCRNKRCACNLSGRPSSVREAAAGVIRGSFIATSVDISGSAPGLADGVVSSRGVAQLIHHCSCRVLCSAIIIGPHVGLRQVGWEVSG